jgi:hypothetical protein
MVRAWSLLSHFAESPTCEVQRLSLLCETRVANLSKSIMNQTVKAPPQDVPQADPPGSGIPAPLETDPLERLATELSKIQLEMLELEAAEFAKLNTLHHTQTESARNLIHHSNNYQTCYWK